MIKQLLALCFAMGVFTYSVHSQACNPPAPVIITNTTNCAVFVTVWEFDAVCNSFAQTVNIPPGGAVPVNPAIGGAFEMAVASDVPPPYPMPPCSGRAFAPWACCAIGPNPVGWIQCNTCGAPAQVNWFGGPGAPMINI